MNGAALTEGERLPPGSQAMRTTPAAQPPTVVLKAESCRCADPVAGLALIHPCASGSIRIPRFCNRCTMCRADLMNGCFSFSQSGFEFLRAELRLVIGVWLDPTWLAPARAPPVSVWASPESVIDRLVSEFQPGAAVRERSLRTARRILRPPYVSAMARRAHVSGGAGRLERLMSWEPGRSSLAHAATLSPNRTSAERVAALPLEIVVGLINGRPMPLNRGASRAI